MRTYYTILVVVYFNCENVCGLKLIYSEHTILCIPYRYSLLSIVTDLQITIMKQNFVKIKKLLCVYFVTFIFTILLRKSW